jgi:hypothetical protein
MRDGARDPTHADAMRHAGSGRATVIFQVSIASRIPTFCMFQALSAGRFVCSRSHVLRRKFKFPGVGQV